MKRVGPAGEVGIAAVGKKHVAALAFDPRVILWSAGQVEFGALDEILGMRFNPGMTKTHVIWNEIKHEFEAALPESHSEPGQRVVAAEIMMNGVTDDREPGAGNVFLAQIG